MNFNRSHAGITTVCIAFFILMIASCSSNKHPVNSGPDGIAIKGFDPVAYFTMGKPQKGTDQFAYKWKGAKWLFSSREHLDLFSSNPGKYAPQYGGY